MLKIENLELNNNRAVEKIVFVGGNGIKAAQIGDIANELGLGIETVSGICEFRERKISQELQDNPKVDPFNIPGIISYMKAREAIRLKCFNPFHNDSMFVTNDAMRVVLDGSRRPKIYGKPNSTSEAFQQITDISGRDVVEVIGSTLVAEERLQTFMVFLISSFYEISDTTARSISEDPKLQMIAGSLPMLTSTGELSGIDVIKKKDTQVWCGIYGNKPDYIGNISSGKRYQTEELIDVVLGGGSFLNDFIEQQTDVIRNNLPNNYW